MNKIDVCRKIRQLGINGAHFQSRQVREAIGVGPNEKGKTSELYNILRTLERDGVIAVVPGDRKRHRYFRISNEEKLRAVMGSPSVPSNGRGVAGPPAGQADRLTRIEEGLHRISERLDGLNHVEEMLTELLAVWK